MSCFLADFYELLHTDGWLDGCLASLATTTPDLCQHVCTTTYATSLRVEQRKGTKVLNSESTWLIEVSPCATEHNMLHYVYIYIIILIIDTKHGIRKQI